MESSVITTKGQIVIPKVLRDKYNMKPGVKVYFQDTGNGLVMKTIDKEFITRAKGVIKKQKNDKPMSVWWKEYKNEESALEEGRGHIIAEPELKYKKTIKPKRNK